MRADWTRAVLTRLEKHTPERVRSLEIQILSDLTARAFQIPGRTLWNKPAELALRLYAAFTVSCMDEREADPDILYREAYAVGSRLRSLTGLSGKQDAERLVFYLYRNIGITMAGELPGEITVPECFFARFYTPRQCAVMSAVDTGIIAGICGGGRLHFTQRITEGCGMCRASFIEGRKQV